LRELHCDENYDYIISSAFQKRKPGYIKSKVKLGIYNNILTEIPAYAGMTAK